MRQEKARLMVREAIKNGFLVRPETCSKCGVNPGPGADGRTKIHGHHHDYSKPLDVEWLCAKCHREETPLPEIIGEKNGYSRLTKNDVKRIKNMDGNSSEVAALFNVKPATIRDIRLGRTWSWLSAAPQPEQEDGHEHH